jgi:DNA modification methylase
MAKAKVDQEPALRPWPADTVERWALSRIKEYPENARIHSDEQVRQIADSMVAFGVTNPVLVDEHGVLIYGHGRRRAAELIGFDELPVCVARGWTDDEKRAYRLADNFAPLNADWDRGLLRTELTQLKIAGFDLRLTAAPAATITGLLASPPGADPDVVPTPPKKPTTRRGDLWVLGNHRLLVDDAVSPDAWKRLFGQARAAMVWTDPPYGVSYQAASGKFATILGDDKRRDELYKMLTASLREAVKITKPNGALYIWHASSTREDFAQAMKAAGIAEQQYLIWVKPSIVLGRADYQWQHEPCFYACRAGQSPAFYGERSESTTWYVQGVASTGEVAVSVGTGILLLNGAGAALYIQAKAPKNKRLRQVRLVDGVKAQLSSSDQPNTTVWEVSRDGQHAHPTQKPVELARRAIENSSKPGEIIADAFLESGTALIGAELTGRHCYGLEIDEKYADVIIERWQAFSKQEATLDGVPFTQVAKDRAKPPPKTRPQAGASAPEPKPKPKPPDAAAEVPAAEPTSA